MKFEALEPRYLLSADLLPLSVDMSTQGNDLSLRLDSASNTLQVLNNADGSVIASQDAESTSTIQITGTEGNDNLDIDLGTAFVLAGGIEFNAGAGDDSVLLSSFDPLLSGSVAVSGGAGNDTLRGPAADSTWTIDGLNSGHVGGVDFSSFENLAGAAANEDTFVFTASGSLDGVVDGGAGGFDSVVLDGGSYSTLTFTHTGADSGLIDRDGNVVSYVGMEPVVANTGSATEVVFVIPDANIESEFFISGVNFTLESLDTPDHFETTTVATAGVTSISIKLGAGNDIITIHDLTGFTGTVKVDGQAGDDTIVLGTAFGKVELTNAAGEGSETIDFTLHSGTLAVSTATIANDTITSSDAFSQLVQKTEIAEEINESLAAGAVGSVQTLLDNLQALINSAQTKGGDLQKLANTLPFIGGAADNGIDKVANLLASFTELVTKAKAAIAGALTLQDVVDALNGPGLSLSPVGPIDTITLVASTSYRGEDPDVAGGHDGQLELLLDLHFQVAVNDEVYTLDFGAAAENLGITLTGNITVDATIDAQLSIGLSTDVVPQVFLVPGGTVTLAVDATADLSGSALNLGLLELNLVSGHVYLDGALQLSILDAGAADGRTPLGALTDPLTVFSTSVFDPDLLDPFVKADAVVTVAPGVNVGGLDLSSGGNLAVTIGVSLVGNPFGDDAHPAEPKLDTFEVSFNSTTLDLLNFANVNTNDLLGMLGGILDTLNAITGGEVMNTEIPFTDKTVGDILDFGRSFKEDVLDPLFNSGDFTKPDFNNDGAVNFQDLKFTSLQDLIDRLAANLNLPSLKAIYDSVNNELSFSIDFFRAFGLGKGSVVTNTQGALNVTDEVQKLTFDPATKSFRLVYRDGAGNLRVTNTINVVDPVTNVSVTDGALLTALDGAIEGLDVAYSGKVGVTGTKAAGFDITFDKSLGNVGPLVFTGGLSLNFGASLGDIASVSTTGSIGMAAVLDTGLTFGIDLSPDTQVQVAPTNFTPQNAAGVTVTQPDQNNFKIQTLTIANANGGTFALGLDNPAVAGAQQTSAIAFNAVLATIQSRINTDLATQLGTSSVTLSNEVVNGLTRTFTMTFNNAGPGARLAGIAAPQGAAKLTGPADSGKLSGDASFSFKLIDGAVQIQERDNNGDPVPFAPASLAERVVGSATVTVTNANMANNVSFGDNGDPDLTNDLVNDVQAAVNNALATNGLSLGFFSGGLLSTGSVAASGNVTAGNVPFLTFFGNDIDFQVKINGASKAGTLRAVDVLDSDANGTLFIPGTGTLSGEATAAVNIVQLATALQAAINKAIGSNAVVVANDSGKLKITNNGASALEVIFASPIKANAGGGRVTLDTPQLKFSAQKLNTGTLADRRLEITVDSANRAFTELGVASVPTRFDGQTDDTIDMTLRVNGADVHFTLAPQPAGTLNGLVSALQTAVNSVLTSTINPDTAQLFAAGDITVERAALSDSSPIKGNRILFVGKSGVVNTLAVFVPDSATNGAITELGYKAGQSETKRSKAGSFFLQDVEFGGSIGLFEDNVAAKASLGFLGLTAEASALDGPTTSAATGKFFGADVDFALRDPFTGNSRISIDQIVKSISAHQFLFDVSDVGGTPGVEDNGFIDGVVRGGLALDLSVHPDGAIAGLANDLAHLSLEASTPNLLIELPGLTDFYGFGTDDRTVSSGIDLTTAVPTNGKLVQDMVFVVGQTVGGQRYETLAFLRAEDTTTNTAVGQLQAQLQTAVNQALVRLQDLVTQGGGGAIGSTITATINGSGAVHFAGTGVVQIRGNLIDIDFDAAGLQSALDALKNLSFDDIIGVLRLVVDFLAGLDEDGPLGDVLGFKIPVIDRSVSDLIHIASDFTDFVDDLVQNPAGSLQKIETKIKSLLGLPGGSQVLSFLNGVLYFNFDFDASTHTTRPFNLNLGELIGSPFNQLVGLSASGNLNVDASFDLDLTLGLDLTGSDKGFFIDVIDTGLEAAAHFHGNNLEFDASLGPVGVFVKGGSAALDGTFSISLADADSDGRLYLASFDGSAIGSDLGHLGDFLQAPVVTGTGSLDLPLFYGLKSSPSPLGTPPDNHLTVEIDLVKLIVDQDLANGFKVELPDFDFSQLSLPGLFTLLSDPSVIVQGLNEVLRQLEGILQGQLLGVKLPLLGDALADNPAAHFIENFRLQFLQPLAKTLAESNVNLDSLIDLVTNVITDVFTNIADSQELDGFADLLQGAVLAKFLDADGNLLHLVGDPTPFDLNDAESLQFEFDLGQLKTITLAELNFDLGIPGFGLSGKITPTLDFAWHLHLGFGINLDQGFYFVSKYDDPAVDGDDNPELSVGLNLNLGSTPGARAGVDGSLLFLGLHLTDGLDIDGDGLEALNPASPGQMDEFTNLYLTASVDLQDHGGGPGDSGDGRLSLPELITQSPLDTFVFDVAGGANLRAEAVVDFGGFDSGESGGLSLASILPSIQVGILVNFEISFNSLTGLTIAPPEVAFTNISLDLGSFIGGFAGDMLKTIGDILDPLAWLIGPDGLLNMRIPLISDLLGQTIRMRDLISFYDPTNGPKVNTFLDFVEELYFLTDLVQDAENESGFVLNFGDFILAKKSVDSIFDSAALSGVGKLFDQGPATTSLDLGGTGDIRKLQTLANQAIDNLNNSTPSTAGAGQSSQRFTAGVTKKGSVEFTILKPETIFALLLGKPATLVTIELPELGFGFMYRQVIPIIGPLAATFSGKITGNLDLGFGYDTLGIQQLLATDNPAYLLNGFFLNDIDPATGADRPEATFSAEIAVGAALSLGVATVGVEGGIGANIFFNLNDPDLDTKVRFSELASNIIANDGNPLAMFDISGTIEFFLRAYIQVLFFEASFEFARLTLFTFEIPFERPGVLASQSGDTLTLNIGPNAAGRIQGDTSDGDEEIHAKTNGDGSVVVWSDQFNVSEGVAATNPFVGVSRIVVLGGEGIDIIDLSGVLGTDNVTVEVHGGAGDDEISGGTGADKLFGDDGVDEIHAGGGADLVRGGAGDDILFGDAGDDELRGDAGNDVLTGGADADVMGGGAGDDQINADSGADTVDLADAGSIDFVNASGGSPTLDLSDKNVPVTVFVKDNRVLVGFGAQNTPTDTILGTQFTFTDAASLASQFGSAFASIIGVTSADALDTIIGSAQADQFYVTDNDAHLVLDGGSSNDRFVFYADPSGAHGMDVEVDDHGENLKDENVIEIIGAAGADSITVTSTTITLDDDGSPTQTVAYVPPSPDPSAFTDQLQIKVFGNGANDTIRIESTFSTVPVRVEGGDGDDVVHVGGTSGLDDLDSFLNANANKGFGLGPLVVVGGTGHDTLIVDDSANSADNVGNINAFIEKREGIPEPVVVGIVSGLGMSMVYPGLVDPIDGHIEYEAVEVVDVQLGTGDDTFVVGGNLNLDSQDSATDDGDVIGATWEARARTNTQIATGRLVNQDQLETYNQTHDPDVTLESLESLTLAQLTALTGVYGIVQNAYTIPGMTLVHGGGGEDDIRVLQTEDLPDQQSAPSTLVTATTTQQGGSGTSEKVRIDIKGTTGYFVLEFLDPTGTDAVPGAEQTVALSYSVTELQLKSALAALRPVGGIGFIDDVDEVVPAAGVERSFVVTFSPQLGNLPGLNVFDTKLLVAGDGGADEISVQSIDQPTYVLGGDAADVLNVNVEIGTDGPLVGSLPDGLDQFPPAKAVTNGVNAELTVDGGGNNDVYFVYLFGGDVDSQINLFDSGVSTGDESFIFGTEARDMFLLRAAVADDGLAFVAMIKPPQVPVIDNADTHVERVNYRKPLDSMKIFALGGDDAFGIDDTRLSMEIYGGEGEDFFQVGQLFKSQRNAAAGVPFADAFATLETTRGFLSNGISKDMKIFGGEGNDEFVVYHNLAPLALFGNDGDDSFLIRAFALVGSQEDLRERTDVSGDAGADLIQYAVNAPVFIDGGDGFDTVIVIGTEFNDDFVVTEDGVFGAGLNITFVRVEVVEVDGDAGDDRFFILGTSAGILTKITGSLGSDTFFANGPTPDVVSNDLLGHSGLISHSVDSTLGGSVFSGIKVEGIASNVADDDEPAVRITVSDGTSVVSQVDALATDHYTVVLTRKPENGATVIVTSRAPTGVKFRQAGSTGTVDATGDIISFEFNETNWNTPQTAVFTAFQTGDVKVKVGNGGGNGQNALQTLGILGTEGSFRLTSPLFSADTALISFDIRGDSATADGGDAGVLNREQELDQLAQDIENAINAVLAADVDVQRIRTTFFIEFLETEVGAPIAELGTTAVDITFNDIVGTGEGFITHDVSLLQAEQGQPAEPEDSISSKFVQGKVAAQRDGRADVFTEIQGGGGTNEVQLLHFDASDGNFKIILGEQVSEEMLFIPLDPLTVMASIENALDAFAGIDVTVTQNGAPDDYSYRVVFNGASAGINVGDLQVEDSNLVKGERTLSIVGGLPEFVYDPDGDGDVDEDLLRGATVKVVAGAGIGQVRLIIQNTANTITVSNPWIQGLDETSRIEILRYEGVVLPATLVQIVGDDARTIDLRETGGETVAFEAPEVHGFVDGNANQLDDDDALKLFDTVTVSLTAKPTSDVTVAISALDAFNNPQLFFAIETAGGQFQRVSSLSFDSDDLAANAWHTAQTVYVFGTDDTFTEGFHKAVLTLTANGGGYGGVVNSVVVDIADNEVALAMVLESAGSTDVVETGNFFNDGDVPADESNGDNAADDSYQVVLSRAPQAGETVTVNVIADPTRTQRGAGLLGIRAFDPEVNVNGTVLTTLQFDSTNWFDPQSVTVTAADDDKVDGDDSKSFAKQFDLANSIEGPLVITGGISEDRSADLEREPVYLPGETNFKPSIGTVQATPPGVDPSFSLTIDLNEIIDGETILDTRVEGGNAGVLTVTTNTNGDPVNGINEVQLLTVDAVSGSFRVAFATGAFSGDAITYDAADPDAVASAIETELNQLGTAVTVQAADKTAFIITFGDDANHNLIRVGSNNTSRVGATVDASDPAEQILTVTGNGGTFELSLGGNSTGAIAFSPDDPSPAVSQAAAIEAALQSLPLATLLGAGTTVEVSGSGSTYIITFEGATLAIPALVVTNPLVRVDEVQTLTLNASLGQFKLTLDGTADNTTDLLDADVTAAELQAALESLDDVGVGNVTVRKAANEPFYTIIFKLAGGVNVAQLEIVDSTLERSVKEALETNLDTVIGSPEDLKDFTLEITKGHAKNKFRVIIGGSDPDSSPDAELTVLDVARPWEAGLTAQVPSPSPLPEPPGPSEYTIEKTNPNLLVDENEETDFFFFNDTDNVTSIGELPTAKLVVTATHLSGLGMGGDQLIGGQLQVAGGIEYTGLEELIINLGPGDNRIIIEDTQPGATTINSGAGNDEFFVETVSGHTYLNAGAGADTVNVTNGGLLAGINALLTVTGDVPQAVALTLGKGSAFDPVALINGVNEIQQITVDATGGTFQVGFIVNGVRHFTGPLAYNVSAAALEAAIQGVLPGAFGFVNNGTPDVEVTRGGNVHRIEFLDQMGERDVPLIEINDLGLTAETGAVGDVLNIDNSADTAHTQAVLTQTSLTGLGMGDLGTAGTTWNEIQTLRLDATAGTFTLNIDGPGTGTIATGALAFNISAAGLDAALESMLLPYLNELRLAADPDADPLTSADTAGGLVEVAKNDDVYVIRLIGLLSNTNVAQIAVNSSGLMRADELPGGAVVIVQGLAQTATRLDGITAEAINEVQRLSISGTAGTFTLTFNGATTAALPFDVTRAGLQLALEALPAIVPGDIVLTEVSPGVFDIEFKGELSSTDVDPITANSLLIGGTATVTTLVDGKETGLNDVQVMTVHATAGTFHLELYLPAIQKTLVTEALAFDASAEQVRRALQHELARKLNGLNEDADLSRTREAFKSDFSVSRIGDTYTIGFQGVTRQIDGGTGVSLLKIVGDTAFNGSGGAGIVTRMDGTNYYGFEKVNLTLGSGSDVLNVQGTSTGSFKLNLNAVHAATNITLGSGNDEIFISSNADLDHNTIFTTAAQPDVFEFLTGTLDDIDGNLNLDVGAGRHRLLVSDEAATAGDTVTISDAIGTPTGAGVYDSTNAAEIQVKGLAFGDITYGAAGVSNSNFFDGIVYWSGAGNDTINIDGTHTRNDLRTTTILNTGLGDEHVTVDLDTIEAAALGGADGFFVLNTMGGAAAHSPVDPLIDPDNDDDTVRAAGSSLPLIIFGGLGDDDIIAGTNEDIVFGDFGRIQYLVDSNDPGITPDLVVAVFGFGGRDDMISSDVIDPSWVISRDLNLGGNDIIEGQADDDLLIGGANTFDSLLGTHGTDYIDGDAGDDLIFGDAARLFRRDIDPNAVPLAAITNPRFQALLGQTIYSRTDLTQAQMGAPVPNEITSGQALVNGVAQSYRNQTGPVASWAEYEIIELYHTANMANYEVQPGVFSDLGNSFGDDYIAGGANHDVIFAQLGDDVVQGDGSIASAVGAEGLPNNRVPAAEAGLAPVGAARVLDTLNPTIALTDTVSVARNMLVIAPSFELATDGDDYIEGNGGSDVVFGGLGQDDIVGDNSSLFSLNTRDERLPHGEDLIFGGAGTNIGRNDRGDAGLGTNDVIVTEPTGHARDSDAIAGDNANIYRLVGINGANATGFLQFNYDQTSAFETRTQRIIPRAVALLDYTPGGPDFTAAALLDIGAADEVHGEAGDDFVYGMKGHDILFGDGQDDDIVGGYGNDWISGGTGQDGVIGDDGRLFTSRNGTVEPLNGVFSATVQSFISTPGSIQQATINVTGQLTKAVDLTPFSQEPGWNATDDEWAGESKNTSDDIIYGGLGSDFLHGASGDDAISGAEALPVFFASPINPGDVLRYSALKAGEFASYDEFDPLQKIATFLLNFDPTEGVIRPAGSIPGNGQQTIQYPAVRDDGDDKIFGDLGNDWLVGGTGRDDMFGGWGDDLMNADDNHDTAGGENDVPDTHPTYEDRAYGGAGRDVLIGNTGGDRLMDWTGEFNSYLVPFAPFGMGTVSRTLQPQLPEFLYALSKADGADPSRAKDTGADPARNGEPFGELGLVRQQDFAWQAQTGSPDDPQAGNIPGGQRDVLRSANFNDGSTSGFFADSGSWKADGGVLDVQAASKGSDAVSVYFVGDALPGYFEIQASVQAIKATAGWKSNSYLIFDYIGKQDFKFAGIDVSISKLVMGHRDASGWHVDEQAVVTGGLKADKYYNMLLAVNGVTATLVVDNKSYFTHTYQPRVVDGYSYGLNWGMVGVGSDNSRGKFDNVAVQVLPPQITLTHTETFNDGVADLFGSEKTGTWQVSVAGANGRFVGTATAGAVAYNLVDLGLDDGLQVSSYLEVSTRLSTQALGGVIFDQYGPNEFKFAAIDATTGKVVIGHQTAKRGWVIDAAVAKGIVAGTDYDLKVVLKGNTVSVSLNNQVVLGYAFNAVGVDGGFGLLSRTGTSSFDSLTIKTDDPAFEGGSGSLLLAANAGSGEAAPSRLSEDRLALLKEEAIARLAESLGLDGIQLAALRAVEVDVADLPGLILGTEDDGRILIDSDGAGRGWFVDPSPGDDLEFQRPGADGRWATPNSSAFGRFDLLSALVHEFGHMAGLDHGANSFMQASLDVGQRFTPTVTRASVLAAFDEASAGFLNRDDARVPESSQGLHGAGLAVFDDVSATFVSRDEARALETLRGSDDGADRLGVWVADDYHDEEEGLGVTKPAAAGKTVNWDRGFSGLRLASALRATPGGK